MCTIEPLPDGSAGDFEYQKDSTTVLHADCCVTVGRDLA